MIFKNTDAEKTTVTRDLAPIKDATGNLYLSIVALSKRANQINIELKEELHQKLEDFSSYTDNLEEIFENREQIEISKIYEKLPKPAAIAIEELKRGKLKIQKV
jgi:DNA-directed RNA polymerase subunit K/omega